MKKESKEMLRTIIRNQELIMKALKIEIPNKEDQKHSSQKTEKKSTPVKKAAAKKMVKKSSKKK